MKKSKHEHTVNKGQWVLSKGVVLHASEKLKKKTWLQNEIQKREHRRSHNELFFKKLRENTQYNRG